MKQSNSFMNKVPVEYIIELGLIRKRNLCAKCGKKMDVKNYNIQLCKSCRRGELEKEIKIFEKAYKDWNNKKLPVEEVEEAEKLVHKMTDERRGSDSNEERKQILTFAIAEFKKMLDERIKKLKTEMKKYKEPEINQFYARINELKEFKAKLEGKE